MFGKAPQMLEYTRTPRQVITHGEVSIASFVENGAGNIDLNTVKSFGDEWNKFKTFSEKDIETAGREYFDLVDARMVNKKSSVLDVGCGTGRYSKHLCRKAGFVEAIDPSDAVFAAGAFLSSETNVRVTHADIDNIPFADETFDFVFCLGVLHHVPDSQAALNKCVAKLARGGYFLLYMYYNLDDRGAFYKSLLVAANILRGMICGFPKPAKQFICDLICVLVYVPLVALSRLIGRVPFCSRAAELMPLRYYHNKSFWVMRNDALDRFGTPLEKRFSKEQIRKMMETAGLKDIVFSPNPPFWHAVGRK